MGNQLIFCNYIKVKPERRRCWLGMVKVVNHVGTCPLVLQTFSICGHPAPRLSLFYLKPNHLSPEPDGVLLNHGLHEHGEPLPDSKYPLLHFSFNRDESVVDSYYLMY